MKSDWPVNPLRPSDMNHPKGVKMMKNEIKWNNLHPQPVLWRLGGGRGSSEKGRSPGAWGGGETSLPRVWGERMKWRKFLSVCPHPCRFPTETKLGDFLLKAKDRTRGREVIFSWWQSSGDPQPRLVLNKRDKDRMKASWSWLRR